MVEDRTDRTGQAGPDRPNRTWVRLCSISDTLAPLDARHSRSASELKVVDQRYRDALEVLDGISVTEAERFGVARQTVRPLPGFHQVTGPWPAVWCRGSQEVPRKRDRP